MLWVPITFAAAFVQNLRFMLQKKLKQVGLSTAGATFARHIWSGPIAVFVLWLVLVVNQAELPHLNGRFWIFVSLGSVFQLVATMCMVLLFSLRNFAIGTTFKRSETILAALVGVVVLQDFLPLMGWVSLSLSLVGLLLLSKNPIEPGLGLFNKGTVLGLGAGLFFGLCGVCYRGASLALPSDDTWIRALTTLTVTIWVQVVIMLIYFAIWERSEISRVIKAWRYVLPVSVTSFGGSALIFTAFTLQTVAYVNAVQQVELIFAMFGSYYWFNERYTGRELLGIIIVGASIVLLILTG